MENRAPSSVSGPVRAGILGRVRLPLSGLEVELRHPTGADDLLLIESPPADLRIAVTLMSRLGAGIDGAAIAWGGLTVAELNAVILQLRQALIGDRIATETVCQAKGCGRRIDVTFSISEYLSHHAPSGPVVHGRRWRVEPAEKQGEEQRWFRLTGAAAGGVPGPIMFRLPTVDDQLSVRGRADAIAQLAVRCLRPATVPAAARRQVEAAMERMAPDLCDEIRGVCPECGSTMTLWFDAMQFCLRELRDRAAFIYEDVDLLARRYHWSEQEIIAMPQARRAAYAELARQEGAF